MTSKPREASVLLVCLGAAVLLPPLALIFAKSSSLFDIPLPVFYVFGTWLLLVVGAFLLSRLLPDPGSSD